MTGQVTTLVVIGRRSHRKLFDAPSSLQCSHSCQEPPVGRRFLLFRAANHLTVRFIRSTLFLYHPHDFVVGRETAVRRFLHLEDRLRTIAYVDGFNLYYRALKGTANKWLDIRALLELVYPKNDFEIIRYFTAHVKPLPHNLEQPIRQQVYLRALRTLPGLVIHLGQFTSHEIRLPLVSILGSARQKYARVLKTEEKGSDVNLASHL